MAKLGCPSFSCVCAVCTGFDGESAGGRWWTSELSAGTNGGPGEEYGYRRPKKVNNFGRERRTRSNRKQLREDPAKGSEGIEEREVAEGG